MLGYRCMGGRGGGKSCPGATSWRPVPFGELHASPRSPLSALLVAACGKSSPIFSFAINTPSPSGDAYTCSLRKINDLGYTVTNTNREAGFITAEKTTSTGFSRVMSGNQWHSVLTVSIFDESAATERRIPPSARAKVEGAHDAVQYVEECRDAERAGDRRRQGAAERLWGWRDHAASAFYVLGRRPRLEITPLTDGTPNLELLFSSQNQVGRRAPHSQHARTSPYASHGHARSGTRHPHHHCGRPHECGGLPRSQPHDPRGSRSRDDDAVIDRSAIRVPARPHAG